MAESVVQDNSQTLEKEGNYTNHNSLNKLSMTRENPTIVILHN